MSKTESTPKTIDQVIADHEQDRSQWEIAKTLLGTTTTMIESHTFLVVSTYHYVDQPDDYWVDASIYRMMPSGQLIRVRRVGEFPFDFDPAETI